METTYYYYEQLNTKSRITYKTLVRALLSTGTNVKVSETDEGMISHVCKMIMLDHPEIFWWSGEVKCDIYSDYTILKPKYLYNDSEIVERKAAIENKVTMFLNRLRFGMSDYDKVKTAFEFVIENIEYADGVDDQNICGALIYGKCVCAGYTRAVQYLLQRLGMECLRVSGVVKGEGRHAWNIVKCDNKYYHVDATCGDRIFDGTDPKDCPPELRINYAYLCCNDEKIYADREANVPCGLPACYSDDLNYYGKTGRYYHTYSQDLTNDLKRIVFSGQRGVEFQFANRSEFLAALQALDEEEVFSDIVGKYYQSIGRTGTYATWISEKDEMLTIACWY